MELLRARAQALSVPMLTMIDVTAWPDDAQRAYSAADETERDRPDGRALPDAPSGACERDSRKESTRSVFARFLANWMTATRRGRYRPHNGGKTLRTQYDKRPFQISTVDCQNGRIYVSVEQSRRGSEKPYGVYRKHFEGAENAGFSNSGVIPKQLKEAGYDHGMTSYIAA